MKRVVRLIVCFITVFMVSMPSYAQSGFGRNDVDILKTISENESSSEKTSRVIAIPRGRLISSAGLQISDEGNGVLGVYAETLCHSNMDKIYMTIYLDMWDEARQDWLVLNDYEYSWSAVDNPNLTDVSVSFDLEGLTRGKTYRLRGMHLVRNSSSLSEVLTTGTAGIILD